MPGKVKEINLEYGMPTVESAIQKMKNSMMTCKGQGYKAVILIHGYGASGVGGSIKTAVKRCLGESSMKGIVRNFAGGEQWFFRKREMIAICKDLENYERRITNNEGVTVVLLK
ncbi:MAG: Smr/MutS family protein [Clostridia bacterium]|nr:Smr/MutS family protein [Clostridia bacterium]